MRFLPALDPHSHRILRARVCACAGALLALLALPAFAAPDARSADPLLRRVQLGARVLALTADDRARAQLADTSAGVRIDAVTPGSNAEAGKLAAGDLILAADGSAVRQPLDVVAAVARHKGGGVIALKLFHDGGIETRKLALKPLPYETGNGYDVVYASVTSRGGRLRTIVTRPRTPGRHPALMLVQGIGTFSTENVGGGIDGYAAIIRDFSARGYVTLRVDKSGCGDSEGGPLRDVDFDTQLDGFRQGLLALRADPSVDPDRIVLFGHSMGGAWAPLLAAEVPVRGIAVYGTLVRTWLEYVLENSRRQGALAGRSSAALDSMVRDEAAGTHYLFVEDQDPPQVLERHPELQAWFDSSFTDLRYYSGLSVPFVRQLAHHDLGRAWEDFPGHALAIYGRSDFLSGETDHALIAAIVNRTHPGHGEFVALDGIDHAFRAVPTQAESFASWGQPGRPLDLRVADQLRDWADRVVGPTDARQP